MGIREFFDGRFFDTRYRTKIHILQLVLMTVAIILTIARMAMPVPTTRANMMALTMVSLSAEEKHSGVHSYAINGRFSNWS